MGEKYQILLLETTFASTGDAKKIARQLVENRLVACCHLIPISSWYRWEGKVEEAEEVLLRCKTSRKKLKDVVEYIQLNHPYAVPEIVVTDGTVASEKYYDWLKQSVEP